MKTVITYGTFDLFHIGHVQILERASALGDRLIVGVSTDEFNAQKGKSSIFSYADRSKIVSAMGCVDLVIPETNWAQKEQDIQTHEAKLLVMGDDWKGRFDHLQSLCEVVYLPRTENISSTAVRQAIEAFKDEKLADLLRGLDAIKKIVDQFS